MDSNKCLFNFICILKHMHDKCIYYKSLFSGSIVYLLLYIDDMLIASKDMGKNERHNRDKHVENINVKEFEMKDLGEAQKILGMKTIRDKSTIKLWLSHNIYIQN